MKQLTLDPIAHISGDVLIPGSKSLSNRILLLSAMSEGTTQISNLLDSDDIRHMLNALRTLGISYSLNEDKTQCTLAGVAGPLPTTDAEMFLGNAGTAMRPLTAALTLSKGGCYKLTGEPRMYERPIGHLVDALRQLGADIEYLGDEGFPPLKINGCDLAGSKVTIDGRLSSQFLTALLMIAPLTKEDLTIVVEGDLVSKPYIEITLHLMSQYGIKAEHSNFQSFSIPGNQTYQTPQNIMVEGDASSASYFLAAAAIAGGTVEVTGVGANSVQGDVKFADTLAQMGAKVEVKPNSIAVSRGELTGVDVDLNHIPDAAMTIATTALFATGTTTIRNIYNWRLKETDRLNAMATELRKVGAEVIEGEDYISITPPESLKAATIDTYNDHRMAMCFSLVALGNVPVTINDPDCTAKTFPDYFEKFNTICQR